MPPADKSACKVFRRGRSEPSTNVLQPNPQDGTEDRVVSYLRALHCTYVNAS